MKCVCLNFTIDLSYVPWTCKKFDSKSYDITIKFINIKMISKLDSKSYDITIKFINIKMISKLYSKSYDITIKFINIKMISKFDSKSYDITIKFINIKMMSKLHASRICNFAFQQTGYTKILIIGNINKVPKMFTRNMVTNRN